MEKPVESLKAGLGDNDEIRDDYMRLLKWEGWVGACQVFQMSLGFYPCQCW